MFLTLTESRKDKDTQKRFTSKICVNSEHIKYIQEKVLEREDTYIHMTDGSYLFVKDSYKDVVDMLKEAY